MAWMLNPLTGTPTAERPFRLRGVFVRVIFIAILGLVLGWGLRSALRINVDGSWLATTLATLFLSACWARPPLSAITESIGNRRLRFGMLPCLSIPWLASYLWILVAPITPRLVQSVPVLNHWAHQHNLMTSNHPTAVGILGITAISLLLAAGLRAHLRDGSEWPHNEGRGVSRRSEGQDDLQNENRVLRRTIAHYEGVLERMFRGDGRVLVPAHSTIEEGAGTDPEEAFAAFPPSPDDPALEEGESQTSTLPLIDFSKADFTPPKH